MIELLRRVRRPAAHRLPERLQPSRHGDHRVGRRRRLLRLRPASSGSNAPSIPAAYNTDRQRGRHLALPRPDGGRQSESVWNDNGTKDYYEQAFGEALGAGGGGCSTLFTAQGLAEVAGGLVQHRLREAAARQRRRGRRRLPDRLRHLRLLQLRCACCRHGLVTIGGTSLSSPIIAAAFALAGGAHGVNYPALTLYGHKDRGALRRHHRRQRLVRRSGRRRSAATRTPSGTAWSTATTPPRRRRRRRPGLRRPGGYDGPTGVGTPNGCAMFNKTGPLVDITGPATATKRRQRHVQGHGDRPVPRRLRRVTTRGTGATAAAAPPPATPPRTPTRRRAIHKITVTVTDNYLATGSRRPMR